MKHYKCGFSHCAHADGKVAEDEAVKIGTRYWHKDCYEVSETIKDIRETYLVRNLKIKNSQKHSQIWKQHDICSSVLTMR